jgi:hypothetical protein
MNILSWFKLFFIEQKLYGTFGKYNRYRRWCLERNATTSMERLVIAREVLIGPGVNTMEAQANELFLRRHAVGQKSLAAIQSPKEASAANPKLQM